jgi:glycosyltransferase involved in cell wall biosynthesis
MPTISVVVPAYNGERTILKTLESIKKQTFSDFEIIVIDDGSTDRTVELVNTVKDERIKIFSYKNGGLPVARNRGIAHAQGEYIAFIDADDLWTPDKLASQLEALQNNPKAGLAYSWTNYMDDNAENVYQGHSIYYDGDVYADLLRWNFMASGSNPLIRREAIEDAGEFEPTLRSAEDWDYWLRIASRWQFALVPKAQVIYRKSSGAMSSKIDVMEKYNLMVIDRAFQAAPPHLQHLKRQSQAGVYEFMAHLAWCYAPIAEKPKIIAEKLKRAITLYPQVLKSKNAQTLVVKLFLLKIFSPNIVVPVLQKISDWRSNSFVPNPD